MTNKLDVEKRCEKNKTQRQGATLFIYLLMTNSYNDNIKILNETVNYL